MKENSFLFALFLLSGDLSSIEKSLKKVDDKRVLFIIQGKAVPFLNLFESSKWKPDFSPVCSISRHEHGCNLHHSPSIIHRCQPWTFFFSYSSFHRLFSQVVRWMFDQRRGDFCPSRASTESDQLFSRGDQSAQYLSSEMFCWCSASKCWSRSHSSRLVWDISKNESIQA